jgi:hypothetical protein
VIPLVYGVWLASQEASKNFYFYIREYAQSFYFNSPCRELFPRLDREGDGNLYLVPLASVVLLIISYRQKSLKLWPLLVYALVIYARVMVTPCTGYLNYGLTLLFLPLVVIFGQTPQWGKTKAITGMIIFWFLLSGSFFWLKEAVVLINSKPVNIGCLSQEKEAQYQRVADFVHQNTKKNEGVYVYPNGPYNQLTKRSSPISVASSWYYDLAPFLVSITAEQLQKEPPRLVILNLNNATSVKTRLNNLPYRVHEVAGQVVFEGLTTPVEDFINQNYEVTKKFELAWVLAKIPNPKPLKKLYVMQTVKWLIKQNNTLIELAAPELEQIDRVKIPLRVKIGPLKFFSKYVLTGWVVDKSQQMKPLSRQFAAGEWQDFWLELNRTENFSPVKIIITLSSNEGFLPWGQALIAEVKTPEVFRRAILF